MQGSNKRIVTTSVGEEDIGTKTCNSGVVSETEVDKSTRLRMIRNLMVYTNQNYNVFNAI